MIAGRYSIVGIGLALLLSQAAIPMAAELDRAAALQAALERGESTWQRANALPDELSSRELYLYALALCEAGQHPERLTRLFEVGAQLQDRLPESRGFGNFRWYWRDGAVRDFNAVEFCMQAAGLIWLRHRDALPAAERQALRETVEFAIQGCERHRVPASYTNIALMNAQNLILLGEGLDNKPMVDEGYNRLETVCIYTWQNGIHEYDSPTYYGVDLDCLLMIEAFCGRDSGRQQARALLELMWHDIAANWWQPAARLAGARSRDYDYLRGLGYLDLQLQANGWLEGDIRGGASVLFPLLGRWHPDDELRRSSREQLPRTVRQKWGAGRTHARVHHLLPHITLSSAGANYGPMDLPLTVNLPGSRQRPRCYFIPDARRDPYGRKKIPAGPHEKTLHLRPFWLATQRTTDALGLVVYQPRHLPETPATLESHFVIPRDVDGFWIGDQAVVLDPKHPSATPVPPGEALVIRQGKAVLGIRVPWTRSLEGGPAKVALVDDGNDYGVVRLTVAHHGFWGVTAPGVTPGAVFWVRIGDGIKSDGDFAAWQQRFRTAAVQVKDSNEAFAVTAAGVDGELALACPAGFLGILRLEPSPTEAVLEIDGKDIGREILGRLECIKRFAARPAAPPPPVVAVTGDTATWEAESGVVTGDMVTEQNDGAFGTRCVWTPGGPESHGGGSGTVSWRLELEAGGAYYLWGRVLAPTPEDDSFFVRLYTPETELVTRAAWHTGSAPDWRWSPVSFGGAGMPAALRLPPGEITLELSTREDGTRIDQLLLTTDPNRRPN